ncbi:MAG: DUF2029 domain-containing protein [Actinobacteria bacterium]|nr:DUF2029 domain-containing protein [Actinomycetota bacterium]
MTATDPHRGHRRWLPWCAVLVGLVPAAVLVAYQLARPHALTGVHTYAGMGYDDGVYLGSALHLLQGSLPWRDFALLHPSGITWLMAPFAALGALAGDPAALAAARIATGCVVVGNVVLAGAVVRSRGPVAMAVASGVLAIYPTQVAATHTVLLEPYLVAACLLGLALLTHDGAFAGRRRIAYAGAVLGVACSIKVWAAVVVLVVAVAMLPRVRERALPWLVGSTVGFAVPVLPFALLAPGTFVHDVLTAQLGRETAGLSDYSLRERLPLMLGLELVPTASGMDRAVAVAVTLLAVVALGAVVGIRAGRADRGDALRIAVAVTALVALAQPPQFYPHYAYFLVALSAPVLGQSVAAIAEGARGRLRSGRPRWAAGPGAAVVSATVVVVAVALPGGIDRSSAFFADASDPGPTIRSAVPAGACVLSDVPTMLVAADRFDGSRDCGAPLDPFGLWLTDNDGRPASSPPPYAADFVAGWQQALTRAKFVVLSVPLSNYVPWTPELIAWFEARFVLATSGAHAHVYVQVPPASP